MNPLTRFSRTVEFIPRHADYQQPDNPQKSAKKSEFGGLFSSDNPPKSAKKTEFGGLFSSDNPPNSAKKTEFGGLS